MKNKRMDHISNIMKKCHSIFTKNFTIPFPNTEKIGNAPEFKFDILKNTIFWI